MATNAQKDRKEQKRAAVAAKIKEVAPAIEMLSGMWDEQTLDILAVVFGVGQVQVE